MGVRICHRVSGSGTATRLADGKETRWLWIRPITTGRGGSQPARQPDALKESRRVRTCAWSSVSRGSARIRSNTKSLSTIPKTIHVPGRWRFHSNGIPAIRFLNMPATKGITPWKTSSVEDELRIKPRRREANESTDEHLYRCVTHGDGRLRANAGQHHRTNTGRETELQRHLAGLGRSKLGYSTTCRAGGTGARTRCGWSDSSGLRGYRRR